MTHQRSRQCAAHAVPAALPSARRTTKRQRRKGHRVRSHVSVTRRTTVAPPRQPRMMIFCCVHPHCRPTPLRGVVGAPRRRRRTATLGGAIASFVRWLFGFPRPPFSVTHVPGRDQGWQVKISRSSNLKKTVACETVGAVRVSERSERQQGLWGDVMILRLLLYSAARPLRRFPVTATAAWGRVGSVRTLLLSQGWLED